MDPVQVFKIDGKDYRRQFLGPSELEVYVLEDADNSAEIAALFQRVQNELPKIEAGHIDWLTKSISWPPPWELESFTIESGRQVVFHYRNYGDLNARSGYWGFHCHFRQDQCVFDKIVLEFN
jgi:hypothetical protein